MRIRALAIAGLTTALLTACSSTVVGVASPPTTPALRSPATPSGPELATQAAAQLEQAGSFHMVAQETNLIGEAYSTMDLRVEGADLSGTVAEDGTTLQLVLTGGWAYLQAPATWWTAGGAPQEAADQLDGAWVRVSDDAISWMTSFTVTALAESIRHPGSTYYDHTSPDVLDGAQVWRVTSGGGTGVAVAAEGTPYPLSLSDEFQVDGKFEALQVTLSEFGAPQQIAAPTDFIDLGD
jgi:hypothetical protein